MAFAKKSKQITIDGVEIVVTELTARKARDIAAVADEWEGSRKAFVEMVRKPDGTPFFSGEDEVDELPTSVVQQLGDAIKSMNDPKN